MKALRYRITTLSPLVLTSKTGDPNIVSTLDFIPATSVYGLFACEYISKNCQTVSPESDPQFREWFIGGKIKFLNAYPVDIENGMYRRYYPIPLSIQVEKNGARVFNLFSRNLDLDRIPRTKALTTFGAIENQLIYTKSVKKSINFHHKRDRHRGVSERGIIFNYESIDSGQCFEGLIVGEEGTLNEFKKIFSEGVYRLGRSRHNQYGEIKLEFPGEIEDFHSDTGEFEISGDEVILSLISDTIILNQYGFCSVDIRDFERVTSLKVKKSLIRASSEERYLSHWRARTPSFFCFKAGSSFLIELNDESRKRLQKLLKEGIGEMTQYGFGRFLVIPNEITHYSLHSPVSSWRKISEKPSTVSELTKGLILKIIEKAIVEQTKREAIEKARHFTNGEIPSTSLISKLLEAVKQGKLKDKLIHMEGKSTKQKLEKLNDGRRNLYDFLLNEKFDAERILSKMPNLQKIKDENLPFEILNPSINSLLEREFFTTFLSILRARAKGGTNA